MKERPSLYVKGAMVSMEPVRRPRRSLAGMAVAAIILCGVFLITYLYAPGIWEQFQSRTGVAVGKGKGALIDRQSSDSLRLAERALNTVYAQGGSYSVTYGFLEAESPGIQWGEGGVSVVSCLGGKGAVLIYHGVASSVSSLVLDGASVGSDVSGAGTCPGSRTDLTPYVEAGEAP